MGSLHPLDYIFTKKYGTFPRNLLWAVYLKSNLYYVFFLLHRVGAGHMAAGRGRSVSSPALDTGEKVSTNKQI